MEENTPAEPSHNTRNIILGIVILAAVVVILNLMPQKTAAPSNNNKNIVVADFASCVAAGYPIAQTYPQTCSAPDGRTFTDKTQKASPDVVVDTPVIAQIVTSPMAIKGKARGNWFSEANLPIELQDENGKVLAKMGYLTKDNWMTTDYVTINTTLKFPAPTTDYGKLVIRKDNPSGDPKNDKSFEVPVRFK
jgi:hypothetical protein